MSANRYVSIERAEGGAVAPLPPDLANKLRRQVDQRKDAENGIGSLHGGRSCKGQRAPHDKDAASAVVFLICSSVAPRWRCISCTILARLVPGRGGCRAGIEVLRSLCEESRDHLADERKDTEAESGDLFRAERLRQLLGAGVQVALGTGGLFHCAFDRRQLVAARSQKEADAELIFHIGEGICHGAVILERQLPTPVVLSSSPYPIRVALRVGGGGLGWTDLPAQAGQFDQHGQWHDIAGNNFHRRLSSLFSRRR